MSLSVAQAIRLAGQNVFQARKGGNVRLVSRKLEKIGAVKKRGLFLTKSVQVDANVHAFGRLIKAAVVEKDGKQKAGTTEKFQSMDEAMEGEDVEGTIGTRKTDAASSIDSDREQVRSSVGSKQDGVFDMNVARQKAIVDAAAASANEPMFSLRAQAKAYELHKVNSHFWNAARLSNLFRVSLAKMRISLWVSSMDEQAKAEGVDLDDTAERLLAEIYGELDFPADIVQVPDRIRYRLSRDTYFYMDDEVKSETLMKALRNKDMVHYREAPRLPKRSIPPVANIPVRVASRTTYTPQPGKFRSQMYMWDISPQKDLYTRHIAVREKDGSFRTGNWQERRFAEDYRRFVKYPMKVPHVRPDESEPDNVPSYARVPEGFKVTFDKN